MAPSARLFAALAQRSRESARRRRSRDLKVESLEPRLALATAPLGTLVSVRDGDGLNLLAPGATAVHEGQELTAFVSLTRKPDSKITVAFNSLAPLEVATPGTTLTFTRANWSKPQTVTFGSLEDGSRDGDHRVPVKMTTTVAKTPQRTATRNVRIDSLDSGVVTPATLVTAAQRGSVVGSGNSGTVVGTYDSVKNLGTATLKVTMPSVKHVRSRTVTVDYSVNPDNTVKVERLEGIPSSKFRLNATYRKAGADSGIFGTLMVMQPKLGQSATAMMTAAALPEAVQNLAATATGVGSLLLSWNAPPGGATSYTVTMTTGTGSSSQSQVTTNTSLAYTGLSPSNSYAFSVTASNAAGAGIAAQTSFGIVVPPQSGPSNLAAVFGPAAGQMTLGWQPPPVDDGSPVVSYTATVAQGDSFQTITTTSTSVVFGGLTLGSGTTYFTVAAANFAGVSATVGLLIDAAGNTIPLQPYTASGLATDGTPFASGGFDGGGNAYSWEAMGIAVSGGMRVGSTLAWNGVTFDLADPNQPNFTWAAGQTIDVAQGDYNTLNLAGAAVNGSQQNQPITLTFTDGLSVVWTQSFSDWCSPQNYGHEAIVSTQSYRDTASGGTNQTTNRIYGYSYTIPAGKTLASVTLPQNPNVRLLDLQMSTATAVNLSGSYTSWGIANGNTQVANKQGFDGGGYYYYSGNLQSTIAWSGATFQFGPVPNSSNGQNNFVQAKGQSIDLPQGDYGWLYLAGAAANGNQQNQPITLTFTDGSTAPWTQSFSDWCGPQNYAGESIIQMQPNWVNQVGNVHPQTNYVYGYAYQIPAGKTLASIKLPNNANVGILGMTMVGNTTQQPYAIGLATDGTPFFGGGFDSDGYAYSWDAMGDANAFLVTLASGNTAMLGGMRVGSTLAWNGVTFDLGSPNQPNFTWAAGQTIGVPQGDYNTLNLAGAAVNGSQQNQQITLTFTDGSSVVWTQSFSDWGSPQTYGHEATVSTQSYRNTASGGTDQFTNYIYGYSYAIPAGKTLASITLPENPNVRLLDLQMSNSTPVNLSAAYNWWGIANGEHQTDNNQGFGGPSLQGEESNYYYSGELGSTITWSGATFQFGPVPNSRDGQNNFVQAKGQTIDLPQGDYGWLYLAGASGSSNQQNQQFTLTFTDGSTAPWTQSFHSWILSNGTGAVELYAGETIIQIQSKWVNEVGNVRSKWNYVFGYAYQIPAGKTLASITLPNQPYSYRVGILGITMVE